MTGIEMLSSARDLLTRGGWVRDAIAVDERGVPCAATSPAAVAYSLGGAIEAAAGGWGVDWKIAALYVMAIFDEMGLADRFTAETRITCIFQTPSVFDWEERYATFPEVLFLLDRSIQDARVNA